MASARDLRAIRFVPPKRLGARALQRSRRKAYAAFPQATWRSLVRRAERLPLPDLASPDLRAFADAYAEQARAAGAAEWAHEGGIVSARVHHEVLSVAPAAPFPPHGGALQRISLAYLRWLLPDAATGEGDATALLGAFARAYCTEEAFAHPDAAELHWHPYAASHRLLAILACGAALGPADRDALAHAARLHAAFVARARETDLGLNHLFKNMLALGAFGLTSPRGGGAAIRSLLRCAREQVLPGGLHAELSPMYHGLVLSDLVALGAVPPAALGEDCAASLDELTREMRAAAPSAGFSDGDIALFGDSWRGEAPPFAALGVNATRPPVPRAGVVSGSFAKLSCGPFEVVVDVGAAGARENAGHGHDDFLSIEVAHEGRRVVLDYGVESYEGEGRDRTRSNERHNGPRVAGRANVETWGSFRVGRRSPPPHVGLCEARDDHAVVRAELRPYWSSDCRLVRSVVVTDRFVAVADAWFGLAPEWEPALRFELARGLRLDLTVPVGAHRSDETSFVYETYGRATPTTGVDVAPVRSGPRAESLVVLGLPGTPPPDPRYLASLRE